MSLLLMTAAISPSSDVFNLKLVDPTIRYRQYFVNIVKYLIESPFTHIVFCDNTDFNIKHKVELNKIAKLLGKKLEILSFKTEVDKVVKHGKGFGEGDIIDYFVDNSLLLKEFDSFYKVTGRYWINNINKIVLLQGMQENFFFRNAAFGSHRRTCSTAFFKASRVFYEKYLYGLKHEVDDSSGIDFILESIFYNKLSGLGSSVLGKIQRFPSYSGISGSGMLLDKGKFWDLKNIIFSKLGFYNMF